jgi:hypothetical protein
MAKSTREGKPADNPTSWYCSQGQHVKCMSFGKPLSPFVVCHCQCHRAENPRRVR